MRERGLAVGDRITLELDGRRAVVTVVGEVDGQPARAGGRLRRLAACSPGWRPTGSSQPYEVQYQVQLRTGGDVGGVRRRRCGRPTRRSTRTTPRSVSDFAVTVIGFSTVLSLLLSTVAALGVFNTVVLNVRERRRDLGMLKSIGMTPRQVVTMVLASMTVVGVVGGVLGIPLGMLAHRYIVPGRRRRRPGSPSRTWCMDVWQAPTLVLLALAGLVIALLGALVPARGAARLTIAEVLHNE